MTEDFLHYLWSNQIYFTENLCTVNGEKVEVIHPGVSNYDSGPDFFNARIKIGSNIWVGNVEVHLKSSDWTKHNHQVDKAYNNVILHVVAHYDKPVLRESGEEIFTLELKFDKRLLDNYLKLVSGDGWIPCQDKIDGLDGLLIRNWLDRMASERLEMKSSEIVTKMELNLNDWEETFYQSLSRSFGFRINTQPFDLLARSLPLKTILKHSDSSFQIEALLFGQAGFLSSEKGDEYYLKLKKEYEFLSSKYGLYPIERHLWKFLRLRPSNFPTVRIAQLSALLYRHKTLFALILEAGNLQSVRDLFDIRTSDYWDDHYQFNKKSLVRTKKPGRQAIDSVIINAVIPVLFTYGKAIDSSEHRNFALDLLQYMPPEVNSIVSEWKKFGLFAENAMQSQALIQLKTNYCDLKSCLRCAIGNKILLKSIR